MKKVNVILAVVLLCAAVAACEKDDEEGKLVVAYQAVKPEIIQSEKLVYDEYFNLSVPDTVLLDYPTAKVKCTFPHVYVDKFIDLHVEILPIYVFGSSNTSGDYYAVSGYVVAHNAEIFRHGHVMKDSGWIESDEENGKWDYMDYASWFMSRMNVDFQLLTEKGMPVSSDKVTFFVTPEPSTTIGERTYTKGFSFTLQGAVTVGKAKTADEGELVPTWKKTWLGCVGVGLNWDDSSSQVLQDRTFEMSTDPFNRTIFYSQQINNITNSVEEDCSPAVARNDERFDFSWVWHVAPGEYSAKDYGFGKMNMKVTVRPEMKGNFRGLVTMTVKDKDDPEKIVYRLKDFECNNVEYKSPSDQVTLLIPAMNRIPVGNVEFKNTTRNYVTDIRIFRTGEKDVADVYSSIDGYYDTNESVSFILREGNYDMVYTIKNGDTGEVIGTFMIEGFEVDRDDIRKISTLDGKRI